MITVFYDEDCFMCRNYASYQKARLLFDEVALVDLRALSSSERNALALASGADLTRGILLKFSGKAVQEASLYRGKLDADGYYYLQGMEATVFMAQHGIGEQRGVFGFFNRFLKHRSLAKVLFPLMRMGRNILLFLNGKSKKFD